MSRRRIDIVGAGLCGSLLGIMLARRGYAVTIRELRADPRRAKVAAGRSINLALSARGIRGLKHAGIYHRVAPLLMPMRGRLIHGLDGSRELLPYGQRDYEYINSVSRAELNRLLIETAEREHGVEFLFGHAATAYDCAAAVVTMASPEGSYTLEARGLISADGAGSVIRRAYDTGGCIGPGEELLPHSYKELTIPPRRGGGFEMENDALHIWPRGDFMLIALPNPPGDFTLTLFMPNEGETSFASLDSRDKVGEFFQAYFPDVIPLIPDVVDMYQRNPVGLLGTIRCRHWHDGSRFLLIGDAAHAVVPFHGQGMNLAFEDCVVLDNILERGETDWARIFERVEREQRANANAIADMALENYVEMRDTVRDPKFALRKALSFELERRLPDRFIPRYSMVMFHDEIPYAVAQSRGRIQAELLEQLTRDADRLQDVDLDAAAMLAREKLPPL
ncbi:MAG: FAD-dependent monooxygenase [Gammaproteobacteria bacterium]|nr:FAD-dependent monooxygenase [Gammaproteobacteria bacterium]MDH4255287.1 FAD-dependent monooxygenase [Gammaproteobacteria bacterium]MDH5310927.1 FAD-dependent monooxygenase [Gammaproteobacteria bacterium]